MMEVLNVNRSSLINLVLMALTSDSSEVKAFGGISRHCTGRCGSPTCFYELKPKAVGIFNVQPSNTGQSLCPL